MTHLITNIVTSCAKLCKIWQWWHQWNSNHFLARLSRMDVHFDLQYQGQHHDVINWKHFPRYWPFVRGIHRLPVNSTHKGQWRGALMFSLIYAWTNVWVNNCEAGDLWLSHSLWGQCNEKGHLNSFVAHGFPNVCVTMATPGHHDTVVSCRIIGWSN